MHYDELAAWVHAMGIPRDRIYSAQAFIAPDAGMRPVALYIRGPGPDYDSAGVSIEGAIPRAGHLGTILYGPAAENRHAMMDGRSLFATLARLDPGWGIVEYNAADLKRPGVLPSYAETYHTLRDLFNFDGSQIAMMAWNGSNGLYAGQPGYVAYTAWRNTPGEEALVDFLVDHADLPRGARLWTLRLARATPTTMAGRSIRGASSPVAASPISRSTPRPRSYHRAIRCCAQARSIRWCWASREPADIARVQVFARTGDAAPWTAITASVAAKDLRRDAAGILVPLAWPAAWRARGTIADRLKIALTFETGTSQVRVQRIALYPRVDLAR